eukprot:EC787639.1.p1 GENE.EC787639.1~~EC787639.1.p1  ORF type:complete len:143 (-),score=3.69 EC787639.1:20-448(-)
MSYADLGELRLEFIDAPRRLIQLVASGFMTCFLVSIQFLSFCSHIAFLSQGSLSLVEKSDFSTQLVSPPHEIQYQISDRTAVPGPAKCSPDHPYHHPQPPPPSPSSSHQSHRHNPQHTTHNLITTHGRRHSHTPLTLRLSPS